MTEVKDTKWEPIILYSVHRKEYFFPHVAAVLKNFESLMEEFENVIKGHCSYREPHV
jgi:hypothetical protein